MMKSLGLLLFFMLNSCMQLQVGDNIRSTGNPVEVYEISLDDKTPVYSMGDSYLVQTEKKIRYTYPASFDTSAIFIGSSTYRHSEKTGEFAWFRLKPEGACDVLVSPVKEPNLKRCKLVSYEDLDERYLHFSQDVFGKSLPEPNITEKQKRLACCFDYFLDPLGTATANTLLYGGVAAAFIFISPSKMILNRIK